MTLSIPLTSETEAKLRQRAAALGKEMAEIAREAIEEKLAIPETFAEILSPIHAATAQAGALNEAELDALVEHRRERVFTEKQARRPA